MKTRKFLFAIAALIVLPHFASGADTKVVVHVKAKDAKFVGTSMGGVLIVIRDSATGEILARGTTAGGTGNTGMLMIEPAKRGARISDDSAAKFETVLALDEPKLVTVEAHGPLGQPQAAVTATTQLWLLPGKDILGDGVMLELSGFAAAITAPRAHQRIKLGQGIPLKLNLVMM